MARLWWRPPSDGSPGISQTDATFAFSSELEIEHALIEAMADPSPSRIDLKIMASHRAALRRIDRLKVRGTYEAQRARILDRIGEHRIAAPHFEPDVTAAVDNMVKGCRSPDEAQRANFETIRAAIVEKPLAEALPFLMELRPAKRGRTGRPTVSPPWRNFADELDLVRLLRAANVPLAEAARRANTGTENRAREIENHFKSRTRLRKKV
jgi:hypothetical protein